MQPLWKTVWNFLRKQKTELPFDLVIPPLGLYPKDPETPVQNNLCTPMFIAALLTRTTMVLESLLKQKDTSTPMSPTQ